jgi:hypothetical protein
MLWDGTKTWLSARFLPNFACSAIAPTREFSAVPAYTPNQVLAIALRARGDAGAHGRADPAAADRSALQAVLKNWCARLASWSVLQLGHVDQVAGFTNTTTRFWRSRSAPGAALARAAVRILPP